MLIGAAAAAVAVAVAIGANTWASATPVEPSGSTVQPHRAPNFRPVSDGTGVADSYIVVLKDGAASPATVHAAATNLTRSFGGTVAHSYTKVLKGFSAHMSAAQAKAMANRPDVRYVEQNRVMKATDTQANPPSWGLDRIDQPYLPVDTSYTSPSTASTVHAYVIDGGIHIAHSDFGGRASYGFNFVNNTTAAEDCDGHGTHVAGTIGGTAYGVAKGVQLVAVKVMKCDGEGFEDVIIQGIDWVAANAIKPAVANMSLGGAHSDAIDQAVTAAIASGVTFSIAAGNGAADSCYNSSPADTPTAITVGATDSTDHRPWWSNFGPCLDVFAPGVDIRSDWFTGNDTQTLSGTSMAAPHVAGAAALILAANPSFTPAQVQSAITAHEVTGAVDDPGIGSPDKLLNVGTTTGAQVIRLRSRANSLVVDADSTGNSRLMANRVMTGPWEEFDAVDAGGGWVGLRAHSNGKFVTADAAGTQPLINNRTSVGSWEKFKIVPNGDGSVGLQANANGRFVTAENAGTSPLIANRTAIGTWEKFDVAVPTSAISLFAWVNRRVVAAAAAGTQPLIANLDPDVNDIGTWETFYCIDLGGGWFALLAFANGRFVTAENAGTSALIANRTTIGTWEKFRFVTNPNRTMSIRANANNKIVTAENAGAAPLIANRTAAGAWEEFAIVGG